MPAKKLTFWAASGFLWQHLASFIKNKIKQSKNKAICYHILVFTVLKEQRVASSQKIHQGCCFNFIKGQRDNCLFSKMNLPVLYIPCVEQTSALNIDFEDLIKETRFPVKLIKTGFIKEIGRLYCLLKKRK